MLNIKEVSRVLTSARMLTVAVQGLVSGLVPALIGGSLLQAWVTEAGVDIKIIGLLTGAATPYTLKFLWAPVLDRFTIPPGRRKGWILLSQACILLAVFYLSTLDPTKSVAHIALVAVVIAYFGATLDIALDAWRREYLNDSELALGLSANTFSFLIAFRLIGGSLALILADHTSWANVYKIMALFVVPAMVSIFFSREPKVDVPPPKKFYDSVVLPFVDYFKRSGALFLLLFILLYKLGDNMGGALTTKYFLDLTYTKTEIGIIGKWVGWLAIGFGSIAGGVMLLKMKIGRALFLFGILQGASTAAFALLQLMPHHIAVLGSVIAFENLTAGLGSAAFATLIARLTNKKFTATQYALLTSVMGVPRYLSGTPTGFMVEAMGWVPFFVVCGIIAVPGIFMSLKIREGADGSITI